MSTIPLPKNAAFRHEKLSVKTASNKPDEKGGYGSLRVFVKVDGSPYTKKAAKTELSFLLKQGKIDKQWQVIPWGNGFAVAPITNRPAVDE